MNFNQKMVLALTILSVGITAVITFTCVDSPHQFNFWIAFCGVLFSQIIFGAFWVQQIARADSVLPVAISS